VAETCSGNPSSKRCLGLLTRKEQWGLSWRGWIVIALAVFCGSYWLFTSIYPFLATTHRVDTKVLVVEGWVHKYAIRAAVREFQTGSYETVFSTGGPVEGSGGYTNDFNTSASVGADLLKKNGLPASVLSMVPSRVMDRDRTYGSAVALKNWIDQHQVNVTGLNIITEDVHARRTRLLFQRAFGNRVRLGVIAVQNPDYDPAHWWRYSQGLKDIVSEGCAYLYAKFFFSPHEENPVKGERLAGHD
jgi:uncharacterized SAM-binding protein YcdF (DUF218 family)